MLKFLSKKIIKEGLKDKKIIKLFYFFTFIVLYSPIAYGYEYLSPPQIQSKILAIENQIERISITQKNLIAKTETKKDSIQGEIKILSDKLVDLNKRKIDLSKKQDEIYKIKSKLTEKKSLLESNRENEILLEVKKDVNNDKKIKTIKIEIKDNTELIKKNESEIAYWEHHKKMYRSIIDAAGYRGNALKDDLSRATIPDALGYVFDHVHDEPKIAKDLIKVIFNDELLNSGHLRITDGLVFKGILLSMQLALLPLIILAELGEDDPNDWRVMIDLWKTNCRLTIARFSYDQNDNRPVREFRKACMVKIEKLGTFKANKLALQWDSIDHVKKKLIPKAEAKKSIYSNKHVGLRYVNEELNEKYEEREREIESLVRSKFYSLYPDSGFNKQQDSLNKDLNLNSLAFTKNSEEIATISNHENRINNEIYNLKSNIDNVEKLLDAEISKLDQEHIDLANKKYMWEQKLEIAIDNNNNSQGIIESFNK